MFYITLVLRYSIFLMTMKKIVSIIVVLSAISTSLLSQDIIPVFTYDESGHIVTNDRFISPSDSNLSSLQFSTRNTGSTSMGTSTYVIKTGRFKHWEEEAGNFDVIQFYKNNRPVLTYKDGSGIVRLDDPGNSYAHPFNRYSHNGYFMEVKIADTTRVLLFLGQHYGTDLSKLIIFAVTPNEVKLVYNQQTAINSISISPDSISLTLQSNIPNEDETAILHTIRSAKGILEFKDN